jgi:hypothetical protein
MRYAVGHGARDYNAFSCEQCASRFFSIYSQWGTRSVVGSYTATSLKVADSISD